MATVKATTVSRAMIGGMSGNVFTETISYTPSANLAAGDRVQLAPLESGVRVVDGYVMTEDDLASLSLSVGIEHEDGSSGDSDTELMTATSAATAGRFRFNSNVPPRRLETDSQLVATFAGAAFPTTNKLTVVLVYEFTGKD